MMTRTVGSIIVQVDKGENERWRGADLPYLFKRLGAALIYAFLIKEAFLIIK